VALQHGPSLARAGFGGSPIEATCALFERVLSAETGVVFAVDGWEDTWSRAATPFHLALPDMIEELGRLGDAPQGDAAYPYVLSAGERRSFTANTIIRDPEWRKEDAGGALRMSPGDAAALGVATGERVRVVTPRGAAVALVEVSPSMQRGHLSLPNGLGVGPGDGGAVGVAPNELTSTADRDPFVGTPWHKHVPARIERV
jgi:anaerobic selenocysteine-containing dehydrogenase